jgi:hypothetical protein
LWVEAAELTTEYYRQLNRPIKVEPASHTSLIECFGHVPSQGLDAWCRWTMDLLAEAFSDSGAEVSGDLLNTNTQAGRIKTANRCR